MWLTIIKILIFIALLVASVQDIKSKKISLFLITLCGILAIIAGLGGVLAGESFVVTVITMIPGILLVLLSISTQEGIGIGDGLMVMALGPVFGMEKTLLGLMVSMLLTSIVSIGILASQRGTKKTCMPFIPFLTIGMGVAMLV